MVTPTEAEFEDLRSDRWAFIQREFRRRIEALRLAPATPERAACVEGLKAAYRAACEGRELTDEEQRAYDLARQTWHRRRRGVRPRDEYLEAARATELRERVVRLHLAGGSASAIARIVGRSRSRVRQILREELAREE